MPRLRWSPFFPLNRDCGVSAVIDAGPCKAARFTIVRNHLHLFRKVSDGGKPIPHPFFPGENLAGRRVRQGGVEPVEIDASTKRVSAGLADISAGKDCAEG